MKELRQLIKHSVKIPKLQYSHEVQNKENKYFIKCTNSWIKYLVDAYPCPNMAEQLQDGLAIVSKREKCFI